MSQKLTLARYLEGRGSVKSLTRIEAEAFGVPYPLVSGWPARHGDMEITQAMLHDLAQRIGRARRSTANKALRGLDGMRLSGSLSWPSLDHDKCALQRLPVESTRAHKACSFPGFALRLAKRASTRG